MSTSVRFPKKDKPQGVDIMKPILKKRVSEEDCYGRLYSALAIQCQACASQNQCAAQYAQNEVLRKKREMEMACTPKSIEEYDIPPEINDKLVNKILKFSNLKNTPPVTGGEIARYLITTVFRFAEPDNLEPSQQEKVERNLRLFKLNNKDKIYYNEQLDSFYQAK